MSLNAAGDRIAVLRTTASSADLAIFDDAGTMLATTSFPYDGRSYALATTATTAYVARAGLPLLAFDGTLRELTAVPPVGVASLAVVDGELAYFAAAGDTVNLALLAPATATVRVTGFNGPSAASYVVRSANDHVYVASCAGLAQINRVDGTVIGTFDTATIGCLTDFVVSPDDTTALALPFSSGGGTTLTYVDPAAWTIGRRVDVAGASGRLIGAWQAGRVFVTTLDYTTSQQAYAGVLDVGAGSLRAIPRGVVFAAGSYGIAAGTTTLSRYETTTDTWRAAAYGGTVTRTLRAPDGTVFAQIGDVVAHLRPGATAPDVFYLGGSDMVLNGSTLYTHDGTHVYASDTNGDASRTLTPLARYTYLPDMAYDAAVNALVLGFTYAPRNAQQQVGVATVDAATGAVRNLVSQSGTSLAVAHDPVNHRVYAAIGAGGPPAATGELHRIDLASGAATTISVGGVALSSAELAFDAARGLLAVGDGASLAAIDATGRKLWTTPVSGRAIDVRGVSWIVGGDNALTTVAPTTGRATAPARVGYQLTDVGMVNDLVYGFDAGSGAIISAQPAANGLRFQIEAALLPPSSWETTPTALVLGDRGGVVTIRQPHGMSGARGNISTFYARWARADLPVVTGAAQRSWTWGPRPWATQVESYAEGIGGVRLVEYRDKTRMEITRPDADTGAAWYVTNGLLVQEMVSGQIQTGDRRFEATPCVAAPAPGGCPSTTPVAGDSENNPAAPSYADMQNVLAGVERATGERVDEALTVALDGGRRTTIGTRPDLASDVTELVEYDATTRHNIPRVFWSFMTQRGPVIENGRLIQGQVVDALFAFGRPITEPYWTQARVGGDTKDVLIQLFERRVLTYTPSNPAQFQVEMGNVGQHYYGWRYGVSRW